MSRGAVTHELITHNVPRASGDEPAIGEEVTELEACSPRERG